MFPPPGHHGQSHICSRCLVAETINKAVETRGPLMGRGEVGDRLTIISRDDIGLVTSVLDVSSWLDFCLCRETDCGGTKLSERLLETCDPDSQIKRPGGGERLQFLKKHTNNTDLLMNSN
ncbi:hypothetical protein AAFF_G00431810 [Aldrovandia affinis]|uniref:Uncharacterized protein n=1 Tax=Aldrovandia affinis TaxID=143900 RepID=A0AAD7S8W9_9TELE|nr:hypothetical protein AAFF_G00431810 [Aldrovandia affinis]